MKRALGLVVLVALAAAPAVFGQMAEGVAVDGMNVTEYGVGTGVKSRNLVGKTESCTPGGPRW